jgi:hypothetical protein
MWKGLLAQSERKFTKTKDLGNGSNTEPGFMASYSRQADKSWQLPYKGRFHVN